MIYEKATIVYFSGTGCTKLVAQTVMQHINNGELFSLDTPIQYTEIEQSIEETNLLILLFPVYAFAPAPPALEFAEQLKVYNNVNDLIVISVSGGGEVYPNKGCRYAISQTLINKGFKLVNEAMIRMPSNWVINFKEKTCEKLINGVPKKVADILIKAKNKTLFKQSKKQDIVQTNISKLEQKGAMQFYKSIHVEKHCTQCLWCVNNCPVKNIQYKNSLISFGKECIMCFRCIYGCPQKAIQSSSFQILKGGFDVHRYQQ